MEGGRGEGERAGSSKISNFPHYYLLADGCFFGVLFNCFKGFLF